jgi:putative phage-type endonuclease
VAEKMNRKGYIGGSDIAAAMGVSRWKTPLQLWSEKTGKVEPEDLSDNEAVEMGIELEETVARLFTKRTGMKVRRAPKNYKHPDHDFMRCQVDRLVEGTDELLECKTANAWKAKEWEGEEIPTEYILQVQWQLMITGRSVGHIAVLIGGQKFLYKKLKADFEMFDELEGAAIKFWDMVQDAVAPAVQANDNSFIVNLYPHAGTDVMEASQDMTDAIAQLQLTKAEIIELEKTKKEFEAKVKAVIGDQKGIRTPEYTAKWIDVKGSTFTVTKKDSRQLRISKNKG